MLHITKITALTILILFGLAACSQAPAAPTPTASEDKTIAAATVEPEPTSPATAVPTQTPLPEPTATPLPTATAIPEPTATTEPSPTPDLTGGGSGKIVFLSVRDGAETFYIMNYDGSDQVVWADNPVPDAVSRSAPRYSPDGSQVAIASEQDDSRNIFVANADGSGRQQITTYTGNIVASSPAWSPDGRQIAYDSNDNDGLHLMNSDGSGHMPLLDNPNGIKGFPSWSPDGSRIVFNWAYDTASETYSDAEIYVINVDGTAVTPLTDNEFQDIGAAWSPAGTQIVFHSNRDGNFEIYVMNTDGSEQTRLTNNDAEDFSPVWSPDGRLIAYTAVSQNEDGTTSRSIMVMNADGTNPRSLTNGQDGFNPYWLP